MDQWIITVSLGNMFANRFNFSYSPHIVISAWISTNLEAMGADRSPQKWYGEPI